MLVCAPLYPKNVHQPWPLALKFKRWGAVTPYLSTGVRAEPATASEHGPHPQHDVRPVRGRRWMPLRVRGAVASRTHRESFRPPRYGVNVNVYARVLVV